MVMPHLAAKEGEALAHAVPSAPITLELHLLKEEYYSYFNYIKLNYIILPEVSKFLAKHIFTT